MMLLGACLLGVACGAGYIMILNEIFGRRMVRRLEKLGSDRLPPPDAPDDDLDISDQDNDIQIRAW